MSKLVVFSVIAALLGILLAYFINLPPPPLTNRLEDWKVSGDYFTLSNSNNLTIFYKVFQAPPSIPVVRPSCSATDNEMVQALADGCETLLKGEQDPCSRFESALKCTHEAIRAQGHDCGDNIIWYLLGGLKHNAQYLTDEYGVNPAACAGEPRVYDTLLLLHGFPTSSYDWTKVLPTLEGKYQRILMLDFLGHGFSSKPTSGYSVGQQADAAEQLLMEQGGQGSSLDVLAHDYGDTVAQELLARFNEKSLLAGQFTLSFVALLNGGIFPQTNFPRPGQKLLVTPVGAVAARLTCKPLLARALGEVFGPATQPSKEDFDDFWAAIMYNNGNLAAPGILDYIRERREKEKRWVGALQETNVKVGIIFGTSDIVNPSPGFENHVKKTVPTAELRVLEGKIGHYPQWEAPDATLAAYLDMAATAA